MRRCCPIAAVCALLLAAFAASAQEPAKAGVVLHQPADAPYPSGRVVIEYVLEQPAGKVEIDIFDAKGAVVAGWTGGPAGQAAAGPADRFILPEALTRQGNLTVTWDLHASGYFAPGAAGAPPRFSPGPLVPPGIYIVQVSALGQAARQAFKVVAEPPLAAARQADIEARFELAMQVRGLASAASAAVRRVRTLQARVAARLKTSADATTVEAGNALARRLAEVEGGQAAAAGVVSLHDGLAALGREVEAGGRPTEVEVGKFQALSVALQARIVALNALTAGSYARFERGERPSLNLSGLEYGTLSAQFDNKGIDFGPWLRVFVATLKKHWTIPWSVMSAKGHVVVTFAVHKSGLITDIAVAQACETAAFNDSARAAVAAVGSAQPLPEGYPAETCAFSVSFFFNETPPTKAPVGKRPEEPPALAGQD
jgi:TonB family protein